MILLNIKYAKLIMHIEETYNREYLGNIQRMEYRNKGEKILLVWNKKQNTKFIFF